MGTPSRFVTLLLCTAFFVCGCSSKNKKNRPPTANIDIALVAEDGEVVVLVLNNDWDLDEDPLTVTSANATNGTVSFDTQSVTYTPALDFHGADTVTYEIHDGKGGTDIGTIEITVTPINDIPIATAPAAIVTTEGTVSELITLTGTDVEDAEALLQVEVITQPVGGHLDLLDGPAPLAVAYTPDSGFSGTDGFSFLVVDSDGQISAPADATVTVTLVPATAQQLVALDPAQPTGTAAMGGFGSGQGDDVGDYLLFNSRLAAVIDQPGIDPSSPDSTAPLGNGHALTGGSLVDLAPRGEQDQWRHMFQTIVGVTTLVESVTGTATTTGGNAFVDPMIDFTAEGVRAGDTLIIEDGLNAGLQYRIGTVINPNTLGLFIAPGAFFVEDSFPPPGDLSYSVQQRSDPFNLGVAYDDATLLDETDSEATAPTGARVTVRLTGGIVHRAGPLPDNTAVSDGRLVENGSSTPIEIVTDYILEAGAGHLVVETRVTNPSDSLEVGLLAVSDVVNTGSPSRVALPAANPRTGFVASGLDNGVPVPFSAFWGSATRTLAYAMADIGAGHMVHANDSAWTSINTQRHDLTPLATSSTLTWQRVVAVADPFAGTSAADHVVKLLADSTTRVDASSGHTVPNGYVNATVLHGHLTGAPEGTLIVARQTAPGLWFDPGPPFGNTAAAGFYPAAALGGSGNVIAATTVPGGTGAFAMLVPCGFAGLAGSGANDLKVPVGFESGADVSQVRLEVTAPDGELQTVQVAVVDHNPADVDIVWGGENGMVEITVTHPNRGALPAHLLVLGMDPDGVGPAPATPDPNLTAGALMADGNTVNLVDGAGTIELPPGAYQIIASRGLEYSLDRYPPPDDALDFFWVSAGQRVTAELELHRLLNSDTLPDPTSGTFVSPLRSYIAAALRTPDLFDTVKQRLTAHLAVGTEMLVVTAADRLLDPTVALTTLDTTSALDLEEFIQLQVGVDLRPEVAFDDGTYTFENSIGRFAAWPLIAEAGARRKGAPMDEYRSPAHLYDDLWTAGATVVQMNTPRNGIMAPPALPFGIGFFTVGKTGFPQPNTGTTALAAGGYATPLRSSSTSIVATNDGSMDDLIAERTAANTAYADFDLMEVLAGPTALYDIVRLDWYALLSAGIVRTATAIAETPHPAGLTRTYIYANVGDDGDVSNLDLAALNQALLPRWIQPTVGINVLGGGSDFPIQERMGADPHDMDVLGTSGVVVSIEVDADEDGSFEGYPGSLVIDDSDGTIDVRLTVVAPPWIPVEHVELIINGGSFAAGLTGLGGCSTNDGSCSLGDLDNDLLIPSGDPFSTALADVVRLRQVYTIDLPAGGLGDHWIMALASGNVSGGSIAYELAPSNDAVVGWTNPVLIDSNDNGEWNPPGVP